MLPGHGTGAGRCWLTVGVVPVAAPGCRGGWEELGSGATLFCCCAVGFE